VKKCVEIYVKISGKSFQKVFPSKKNWSLFEMVTTDPLLDIARNCSGSKSTKKETIKTEI